MTRLRLERFGPTWRKPSRSTVDAETTHVFCACGVDMEFVWPRGEESVFCSGCGRLFERPAHFPAQERFMWNPPLPPRWAWARAHRGLLLLLLGMLLGSLLTALVLT